MKRKWSYLKGKTEIFTTKMLNVEVDFLCAQKVKVVNIYQYRVDYNSILSALIFQLSYPDESGKHWGVFKRLVVLIKEFLDHCDNLFRHCCFNALEEYRSHRLASLEYLEASAYVLSEWYDKFDKVEENARILDGHLSNLSKVFNHLITLCKPHILSSSMMFNTSTKMSPILSPVTPQKSRMVELLESPMSETEMNHVKLRIWTEVILETMIKISKKCSFEPNQCVSSMNEFIALGNGFVKLCEKSVESGSFSLDSALPINNLKSLLASLNLMVDTVHFELQGARSLVEYELMIIQMHVQSQCIIHKTRGILLL
jgi:hypothetical protein